MSDEDTTSQPNRVRQTVSLTHRQLGIGGGIVAALMAISPVKEMFYTRDEAAGQVQRLERIELQLASLKDEISHRMERNTDKIIDRIKEVDERTVRNQDRLERRVDNLEAFFRIKASDRKSN